MTPPERADWSDERLAAAFVARAGSRELPRDLVPATVDRLRDARGAGRSRPTRFRGAGLLAATVGAIVLAVATMVTVPPPLQPSGSVLERVGLLPMTVEEAMAIRDGGVDDREIAVRGWFSPGPATMRCVPSSGVESPIRRDCPASLQWLLGAPEPLGDVFNGNPPDRPAIAPVFPFLDLDAIPSVDPSRGPLPELVVLGHFDDRRSIEALCGPAEPVSCPDTFVVDRIVSVDGTPVGPSLVASLERYEPFAPVRPAWTVRDVDRIVGSVGGDLEILSRTAIAAERVRELEPSLGTGAHEIIDRQVAWLVNALVPIEGRPPRLRTFLLVDDSIDETYEAVPWSESATGFVAIRMAMPTNAPEERPTPPPPSPNPTIDPSGVAFPTSWLGLPVVPVTELATLMPDVAGQQLDDRILAVRGWYLPPDPLRACPAPRTEVGPISQPCPEGQHWLLETPEDLSSPGDPAWIDRRPTGPFLNPIVRPDTPFDVPSLWFDTGPNPLPVVVLAHVADPRAATAEESVQLVVDALVWRAGEPATAEPYALVPGAVEDVTSVLARVEGELGPAISTHLTIVAGSDLATLYPEIRVPELAESPAVWLVRRLVPIDDRFGMPLTVTADRAGRVWSSETEFGVGSLALATTEDVEVGDGIVVEVADTPGAVISARAGEPGGAASWINHPGPETTGVIGVGVVEELPNELRIAWTDQGCVRRWRLEWWPGHQLYLWPAESTPRCRQGATRREVVLAFEEPVDLEAIEVVVTPTGG